VRCFLDTGDAKSTSGLCQHAKMCWGDKAVSAADNTRDLDGACAVLAKSGLKRSYADDAAEGIPDPSNYL
jgi:hypothetical protein